jgi:AcrR family transcriptional regulator
MPSNYRHSALLEPPVLKSMVRPRFARLPQSQQDAILRAALDEFAAHNFHDASLNRVIEIAGISKGSMYYYFDGKEDLYAHVARVEFERLFAGVEPLPIPVAADPEVFWPRLENYYLQLMTALAGRPQLANLIRNWIAASGDPALQQARRGLEQAVMPWIEKVLASGQEIGAVRTDLPRGLLIAVVAAMGQAMDTWMLTQQPDDANLPRLIGHLIGMMRRALEP